MNKKINFILALIKKDFLWERSSLINALISSLSPEEACTLLKLSLSLASIRQYVVAKVLRDVNREFLEVHRALVQDLMNTFDSLTYKEKISCSCILSTLYPALPRDLKLEVAQFLLSSRYVFARRKACKLIQQNWMSEYADLVIEAWDKYKDPEIADVIVEKLPIQLVKENFDALTNVLLKLGPNHLARLYIRLGKFDPEVVDLLRNIDEITYAYVCSKINKQISYSEAIDIFEKNRHSDRVGLLLWAYGQLGLWKVLEKIASRVEKLQKEKLSIVRRTAQCQRSRD